jgi:hypothetical protein
MLKEATYKDKFHLLDPWLPQILQTVKSALKNEHLREDPQFVKKYFGNKSLNKLTETDLAEGYRKALQEEESAEKIAEFISNHWLLKHTELYQYFEEQLQAIDPNFTEIEELDLAIATTLMNHATQQFGAMKSYLFSVINSVVFPQTTYEKLRQLALQEERTQQQEEQVAGAFASLSALQTSYETKMARLSDRYEKKLQGLEKKYCNDTAVLKKQVATLQKKLNER